MGSQIENGGISLNLNGGNVLVKLIVLLASPAMTSTAGLFLTKATVNSCGVSVSEGSLRYRDNTSTLHIQ